MVDGRMSIDSPFQGSLFADDFLGESIMEAPQWKEIDDRAFDSFESALREIFKHFPIFGSPNESQTEDDVIWPVLTRLGWTESLRQQNLSPSGREDVPDGLLFADSAAKGRANNMAQEWRRYEFGLVAVESKRWMRPLDRRSRQRGEESAPSTQMLRYLRRIDDLTTGQLRWGILTNGAKWRLYYQGARSVSEQFFEVDLAAILDLQGHNEGLFAFSEQERRHWLRVFALIFGREAFLKRGTEGRTFHQYAIEEGHYYEERVAANISELVFGQVFPALARAIAAAEPEAPLSEVREAVLVLLYRLLFIFYAEDRNLLPVHDARYDDYALRDKVRRDVGHRKDQGDTFAERLASYWPAIDGLSRAIDGGEVSIGLPPYNGGLFDKQSAPLLERICLGDRVMADVIDALSFERGKDGRRYINYRDLGVRQLGSIYERLLEHELVRDGNGVAVRPNVFARKGSGSYYTPDDLVGLIVEEAMQPLVRARIDAFSAEAEKLPQEGPERAQAVERLAVHDPAERLLELKVCDPAMGSGHFLVSLVDYLSDQVITAMADAEATAAGYISPLAGRIETIRDRITANATERKWAIDPDRLDDRHIVRRMVLKRCIYGVDKNPMAVELAKVALWLHTFTVGAPLSFLDHHLRCGDSLFGAWARSGIDRAVDYGSPLLLHGSVSRAEQAAQSMQMIEALTDAEIAEAHRSAETFIKVEEATAPLNSILSLVHAVEWLQVRDREGQMALQAFFAGQLGDPIEIAQGRAGIPTARPEGERFSEILQDARKLIAEERFLNWQAVFPGVWASWQSPSPQGGFDAVIGNPPWDRMKLQEVEWFATRRRKIAMASRASDRKDMIAELYKADDPLAREFTFASNRVAMATRMARCSGDYPLLSGGDVNLYSLFVERAMTLVKTEGIVGLLTPSGIASDKTAARFFKSIATQGRLKALYDFENRRTRYDAAPFFPQVDSRFKFCAFVFGRSPLEKPAQCAFFLQDVTELCDPNRRFSLTTDDFSRVNPNTGTAPIFRNRKDADITTDIYERIPVLVNRTDSQELRAWPVKYSTMFHMTNDSNLFRTRWELQEKEGAYPINGNRWRSAKGEWLPLYEGKMAQAFDHRAASVIVNPQNRHRPAQPVPATPDQHADPIWLPEPQYWVLAENCDWPTPDGWVLGFKEITAPTNERTFHASIFPRVAFGNKIPLLMPNSDDRNEYLLCANFNSIIFDFITRQKIQGQTLNLFILEQLPVIPLAQYEATVFGNKTAKEIVSSIVLELTYTAKDLTSFARDLGYVNEEGSVRPPFTWDDDRRLYLRAKLDAVYFHLFGVVDRNDIRHIYSAFPITKQRELNTYGRYRSCEFCLSWINALAADDPDAEVCA